jgi:SPP1 gp7 family putative phage head morphogenesis protein
MLDLSSKVKQARKARSKGGGKIKGRTLRISAGMQERFVSPINKAVASMVSEVNAGIEKLFSTDAMQAHQDAVGLDATVGSDTRILMNGFQKKFDQIFGNLSTILSQQLAQDTNNNSAVATEMSLKTISAEFTLDQTKMDSVTREILKASAARAAGFIKSIPEQYLNDVQQAVYNSITTGQGLADLNPYLEKQGEKVKNWAGNTAMDQTRKTFNNLNLSRMKNAGIKQGEWIHSGGSQHPRQLHEDYDGKSFNLDEGAPVGDDDGNNVMPGEEPNCRCTFVPIVTLSSDDDTTEADETL